MYLLDQGCNPRDMRGCHRSITVELESEIRFIALALLFKSTAYGYAASMSWHGAIMSGFTIPPLYSLGPLELKATTLGAGLFSKTVPSNVVVPWSVRFWLFALR